MSRKCIKRKGMFGFCTLYFVGIVSKIREIEIKKFVS